MECGDASSPAVDGSPENPRITPFLTAGAPTRAGPGGPRRPLDRNIPCRWAGRKGQAGAHPRDHDATYTLASQGKIGSRPTHSGGTARSWVTSRHCRPGGVGGQFQTRYSAPGLSGPAQGVW